MSVQLFEKTGLFFANQSGPLPPDAGGGGGGGRRSAADHLRFCFPNHFYSFGDTPFFFIDDVVNWETPVYQALGHYFPCKAHFIIPILQL